MLFINATLSNEKDYLHVAAETGDLSVIDSLFQRKAAIVATDETDRETTTRKWLRVWPAVERKVKDLMPLHIAVVIGDVEIAGLLFNYRPELKSFEGKVPPNSSLACRFIRARRA
ncbi:hypothetical protein SBOR_9829 [Sclerotinia borealis F-4128]|uniref:Ankyrin repeat protein n=1 Tax=Sclerotinia borealis (strain F-4128) TaxID=1432307 RepID=W9C1N2_SCLBF|nr:hypothetical protein SBOR_9829 [Sclerotinia borealis F-4128]